MPCCLWSSLLFEEGKTMTILLAEEWDKWKGTEFLNKTLHFKIAAVEERKQADQGQARILSFVEAGVHINTNLAGHIGFFQLYSYNREQNTTLEEGFPWEWKTDWVNGEHAKEIGRNWGHYNGDQWNPSLVGSEMKMRWGINQDSSFQTLLWTGIAFRGA